MCLLVAVTAASVPIGAASAAADVTERVSNGGFETGATLFEAPPWSFTDANVCNSTCGGAPASGSRYASTSFGFTDDAPPNSLAFPIGHFDQSLVVPETPAELSFKFRIVDANAQDVGMRLTASLDGTVLIDSFDDPSTSFQQVAIAIPPDQIDMSVQTLRFEAFCTNMNPMVVECDRIDVDDVALLTGPPETAIDESEVKRRAGKAKFKFSSSHPGATFKCKLDRKPFKSCSSPRTYKRLMPGKHRFKAAAIDAGGNVDPTPAVKKFRIS